NYQRGVAAAYLGGLALQVEGGEAVVVHIARDQWGGLYGLRIWIDRYKEALAIGTAILAADRIENLLLRAEHILIRSRNGNGNAIVQIVQGSIIGHRQGWVAARDHRGVVRKWEDRKSIGGTSALLIVAEHAVIGGARPRGRTAPDLETGFPGTLCCSATHAQLNASTHAFKRIRWMNKSDARFGICQTGMIGYGPKIRGVLDAIDRRILDGKVKKGHAIVMVVTDNYLILEIGVRCIGKGDHFKVQFNNNIAGKDFRGNVVRYPSEDRVVVRDVIFINTAKYFCAGSRSYR